MTQQPRGSEVIARSIVMNVFSEFDPVDHTVFIPLDANTANALEGAIKYELDAKDAALLAVEKRLNDANKFIAERRWEMERIIVSNYHKSLQDEISSLKAELEAARSESKRIVAIAGKELLAAQAQNERLVLAISEASLNLQSDLLGEGRNPAEILEEALKEASPSTPIHEAIEESLSSMEHIYHAIRGCSDIVEGDGFGDIHPKNRNLREAYKKVEASKERLRKSVGKV